jgi:hypothetical protein
MEQRRIRHVFLIFGASALIAPMVFMPLNAEEKCLAFSSRLRLAPGINSFAIESSFPVATSLSIGFALFLAVLFGVLLVRFEIDPALVRSIIEKLSLRQKIFRGIGIVLFLLLPWSIQTSVNDRQFSYQIFRLVGTNLLALGIFSALVFSLSASALIYLKILFTKED